MGKKGYYFTLTVVLMLGVLAIYISNTNTKESAYAQLAGQRLDEINTFISSTKADASVAMYVATYRSLLVLEEDVLQKEGYVPNAQTLLRTLIINGTLYGEEKELLGANTLNDWNVNIQLLARYLRIELELSDMDILLTQTDPWHVQTTLTGKLVINDTLTDAVWDLPMRAITKVPIANLYDPLYIVGSDQRYFQRIIRADTTNVHDILSNHYYIASSRSPSYLDRLEGRMHASEHGIESLVDVPALASVDVVNEGSIIDWHYLEEVNTAVCPIPGEPVWAVINIDHAPLYGVTC